MDELLTATDLDQWSPTLHARGHLPSLVRAAVMATVAPESISFPAAEGVGKPGFDALIEVARGAPPYVPDGRSVWEIGTNAEVGRKASEDYLKRARKTGAHIRSEATFVFVTSRRWPGKDAWVRRRVTRGDWAQVRAYDAEDLALWLEAVPGVRARFSELLGRQPYGITPLRHWAGDWCEQTDPALPLELLLAGRRPQARRLVASLLGTAYVQLLAAGSRDEAVAYLAACLLTGTLDDDGPGTHPRPAVDDDSLSLDPDPSGEPPLLQAATEAASPVGSGAHREALAERTLVVHDPTGWRRATSYDRPLVLVPLFDDPNLTAAMRAGHTIVLARRARSGDDALPPLDRVGARAAAQHHGLPYPQADELGRAARRSLTSLRRRISRGRAVAAPAWANGAAAGLLAPLLLAAAWRDDVGGDREVLTALADGRPWRNLLRDLAPLRTAEDAPLAERDHRWQFVDVVDAWDALAEVVTSDDLDTFHRLAEQVLTEREPAAALSAQERRRRALSLEGLPVRRYSGELRHGLADTAALLGAVVGSRPLGGGRTGQQHADQLVYRLLHDADADRWAALATLLPMLAEAAPAVFLDAVEQSLQQEPSPVMALFNEELEAVGLSSWSRHSHLLWSLEALAYSQQWLSRTALALARLAALDPGGRLANRPSASLHDALHLAMPQSAATAITRLAILDRIRAASPAVGWNVMMDLVRSLDRGMMLRTGPKRRDWPADQRTTIDLGEVAAALNDLAERLAADASVDATRWGEITDRLDRFPATGRRQLLDTLELRWAALDAAGTADVAKRLAERIGQHERHPQARWALPAVELDRLRAFAADHAAPPDPAGDLRSLFSWRPRHDGRDLFRDRELLCRLQQDTVRDLLSDGVAEVLALAAEVQQPWALGATLAAVTGDHDEHVLDLLGRADPAAHQLAGGLVAHRHATDTGWLAATLPARPAQALALLLVPEVGPSLLALLATQATTVQDNYWLSVSPWRVRDDAVEAAVEQLLAHDRPYSALVVLSDVTGSRPAPFPIELTVQALRAPLAGTRENLKVVDSAAYVIGLLLDRLEAAEIDAAHLAELEWFYLPLLDDQRPPRALYQRLATDPAFFAELVSLQYRADDEPDAVLGERKNSRSGEPQQEAGSGVTDVEGVTDGANGVVTEHVTADGGEVDAQVATVAWTLLHDWHAPLPGARQQDEIPSTAAMTVWVDAARAALARRQRSLVASSVIGQALSGALADPDGTWPSLPVRDVLEREQDAELERQLAIGRFNQRGVTMRSPYAGGQQERELAARYQTWASRVRDSWPRAGVVLDGLARDYLADALREDASAARTAER